MSDLLVDNGAHWPDAVPAPQRSDTLANGMDAMRAGLQALADRTAAARDGFQITSLRAGSISDMKALEFGGSVSGGHIFHVWGVGLFEFVEDVTGDVPPLQYGANDGSGAWFLLPTAALGAANGIATLDATSRVPAAKVRNGIIETYGALLGVKGTLYSSTGVSGYSDVGAAAISIPNVLTNDVLMLRASIPLRASATAGGSVELYMMDGTVSTELQQIDFITNADFTATLIGRYVAARAATHTFKPRHRSAGGTMNVFGQVSLDVMHIRP